MSEILINTYKRTANPMYNLLVVLIYGRLATLNHRYTKERDRQRPT